MTVLRFFLLLLTLCTLVIGWAYREATADPIVRRAQMVLPDYPAGKSRIRVLLLSDIHIAGPDMPPVRLIRIVAKINALRPDVVLIAGDFVSDRYVATARYTFTEAVAPLGALRSPLGTIAVLGNHDHWRDAIQARTSLADVGITVLDNEAMRVGPMVVGGLDDAFTNHADIIGTIRRMQAEGGGAKILLSHSPDPFHEMPDDIGLMVAGHTHCGQIRLPFLGALSYMSRYGDRYGCGIVREGQKTLVVGAGLGTSLLPLRLNSPPDMWLLTIGPRSR